VADEGTKLSRFGVEEFVTDAVIMLHYLGIGGGSYHSVQVRKMRQTAHEKDIFPMEIVSGKGIVIKKNSV
jgi:KaiC/GvpD/RAD55 family RecA-like ATPase